jgi:hypothetical protein
MTGRIRARGSDRAGGVAGRLVAAASILSAVAVAVVLMATLAPATAGADGGGWWGWGWHGPGSSSSSGSSTGSSSTSGSSTDSSSSSGSSTGSSSTGSGSTAAGSCTFNNNTLPLVTGVTAGSTVTIACTGEKPNQLLLMAQASLLIGLVPGISSLLGGHITLLGLLQALPALGDIDLGSLHFLTTSSTGTVNATYTVPNFSAIDRNAVCPPTAQQFADGLVGCALVLLDINTLSPLPGGYALLSNQGNLLDAVPLTQIPTVALSPATASPGTTVSVSDAPGATTTWWLATLAGLEGLLSGGASPVTVTVTVDGKPTTANLSVASATYSGGKLAPPRLSGSFTVPAGLTPGPHTVTVSAQATLLGLPLPQSASTTLTVP